jgi:hypothetical protein
MKLKTFLIIICVGLSIQTRTTQLFEEFNHMLDKDARIPTSNPSESHKTTDVNHAKEEQSIFDVISTVGQKAQRPVVNESTTDISFLQKNKKELTNLKDKVKKLKHFNINLGKHIDHKAEYERKKNKLNDETISLIEKSEKSLNESSYKNNRDMADRISNFNVNHYSKDLDENVNFLQTELKATKSKISKMEGNNVDLTNVESAIVKGNLIAESGNIKSANVGKFDFGAVRGDSNGINLDGNSELLINDKSIQISYLLKYHKMMEQLRQLCGNDLTKCEYYDPKKVEDDAINQTTLLSEIERLKEITERLDKN